MAAVLRSPPARPGQDHPTVFTCPSATQKSLSRSSTPNDELYSRNGGGSRSKCRVSEINRPSTILRHGWHMPNQRAATTHLPIMRVLPTTAGRVRSGTGDATRNIAIAR